MQIAKGDKMTSEQVQSLIQNRFPQFSIDTINPYSTGQYNDVYEINGAWIFRFPKFAAGLEQLALETRLLQIIGAQLPLPVPQPAFIHLDPDIPHHSFCGYRRLQGEPFWLQTVQRQSTEIQRGLARQLGHFLHVLHHLPLTEIDGGPLPLCDTAAEWLDIYERIQLQLFPLMRLDACKTVAVHFEEQLLDNRHIYTPQLRHGDFGSSNILFDGQTKEISGVLDFSFTTLGDPAVDFAGLLMYGEPFVREMTAVYPTLDTLWPRIRFYQGTFPLLEALYGAEHDDAAALQAGLADYI
jgi:aminoglycoside 2''-phosphotransferase